MAYDVARVRGLHPSLGDGWVHMDPQNGMLLPDTVSRAVSTAFRGSRPAPVGPHPAARRSAAVLTAARQAVADLLNADPAYSPNLDLDGGGFQLTRTPREIPVWLRTPD